MSQIKKRFPEVKLINIMESCEDPESPWFRVTVLQDEDRDMELREFAGDIVNDIFMDYGYHMLVMPIRQRAA